MGQIVGDKVDEGTQKYDIIDKDLDWVDRQARKVAYFSTSSSIFHLASKSEPLQIPNRP